MKNQLLASGRVASLCVNGAEVDTIQFYFDGPAGDVHRGFTRDVSGHDGAYKSTSALVKGDEVLNWRSWTAVSEDELTQVEEALGVKIPQGCLLENMTLGGIPNFSQLPPTSRLVFPKRDRQLILAVWEENGPCHVVGQRLSDHYQNPELKKRLIAEAQGKRGVMGIVLSEGVVEVGDQVLVYPPAQ